MLLDIATASYPGAQKQLESEEEHTVLSARFVMQWEPTELVQVSETKNGDYPGRGYQMTEVTFIQTQIDRAQ